MTNQTVTCHMWQVSPTLILNLSYALNRCVDTCIAPVLSNKFLTTKKTIDIAYTYSRLNTYKESLQPKKHV